MGPIDHRVAATEAIHPAWDILDDASQVLVRAEALVMLLRCAHDVEEHHRYGAEIAWDFLRTLKEMLSDAQAQIRPPITGCGPSRSHLATANPDPDRGGQRASVAQPGL